MQTKIRKSALATVLCGVTMLFSIANTAQAAIYKSPNGYQITVPNGWTQQKGFMGTEVAYTDASGASISVLSPPEPVGPTTLTQIRLASVEHIRRILNDYKLVKQGNTKLGGVPAAYITSSYSMGTPKRMVRVHQVIAVRHNKLFVFTATASKASYPRYAATFHNMLQSVRWINAVKKPVQRSLAKPPINNSTVGKPSPTPEPTATATPSPNEPSQTPSNN